MISAIITAAGRNRRMEEDQRSLGIEIQNKLLLDLHGKPVIIRSLENVLNTDVTESTIVLGYFNKELTAVLKEYVDVENIEIIVNTKIDVELSETLLNGVNNIREGL
ncbi:MAG: NTP transferase domain-containing protein, partial [Methanothermobacter sp.]